MSSASKVLVWITAFSAMGTVCFLSLAYGFASASPDFKGQSAKENFKKVFRYAVNLEKFEQVLESSLEGVETIEIVSHSTSVRINQVDSTDLKTTAYGDKAVHNRSNQAFEVTKDAATVKIETQKQAADFKFTGLSTVTVDLDLEVDLPKMYQGKIVVRTLSGDIDAELRGISNLVVDTTSGSLGLVTSNSKSLKIESMSGDIDLKHYGPAPQAIIKSISGDLDIALDNDFNATIQAKSVSGDVTSEAIAIDSASEFELNSVSGDITIQKN